MQSFEIVIPIGLIWIDCGEWGGRGGGGGGGKEGGGKRDKEEGGMVGEGWKERKTREREGEGQSE